MYEFSVALMSALAVEKQTTKNNKNKQQQKFHSDINNDYTVSNISLHADSRLPAKYTDRQYQMGQLRDTTSIWTLESDSKQRAFNQSTQSVSACGRVYLWTRACRHSTCAAQHMRRAHALNTTTPRLPGQLSTKRSNFHKISDLAFHYRLFKFVDFISGTYTN